MSELVKRSLLSSLISESSAYTHFYDLEKLLNQGESFALLPLQPLYLSLKHTSQELVAEVLPKLSSEQRSLLMDLDIWFKDDLDIEAFSFWPSVYHACSDDETKREFIKSEYFLFFLKSRVNVYTFDVEDPQYPDHDNYFLTEDNLLLIEYDENFPMVMEVKNLIRLLYSELGVEEAYVWLFKMVSDTHSHMQEELYYHKKERLRDFGVIDYYEALEVLGAFSSRGSLESYILGKRPLTGTLDQDMKNQALHRSTVVPFREGLDSIHQELEKLDDGKRQDFLRFNFVRLVNASLVAKHAINQGTVAINKVGSATRSYLNLGYEYIRDFLSEKKMHLEHGVFSYFEFTDCYRVGQSLVQLERQALKKELKQKGFLGDEESFLGESWSKFLDYAFMDVPEILRQNSRYMAIENFDDFKQWQTQIAHLVGQLPYISILHRNFKRLEEEGLLNDNFYLNYSVRDIDFEAIILSSLMNFSLGHYGDENASKMGLSVAELREFVVHFAESGEKGNFFSSENEKLSESIEAFVQKFSLDKFPRDYFLSLLKQHLDNHDFAELADDDFRHIGGPILLIS